MQRRHRIAFFTIAVLCAISCQAQKTIAEQLEHVIYEDQDFTKGLQLYNAITPEKVKAMSDSVLFNYHYLGGYINSEIPNHPKAIEHLLVARRLCETKLGTHTIPYMEIMKGLGDEYNEMGEAEKALEVFQDAIVKSMAARDYGGQAFGNLIIGVADCYEALGWFNEVPNHFMDAWSFWNKNEDPLVTYRYFPLWSLEQFYFRYRMYDDALKVSHEIERFIITKGGKDHPELCNALYRQGNILREAKKFDEAITIYERAIIIFQNSKNNDTKILDMLYGNLLMVLAETDRIQKCDNLLTDIRKHCKRIKNNSLYTNSLYSLAGRLNDKGNFFKALQYNETLLKEVLSEKERAVVEKQSKTIKYKNNIIESLPQLQEQFSSLSKGSDKWFAVANDLSNAYFIKNDFEKNNQILISMYNQIVVNPANSIDYHLGILSNLFGNSIKLEDYDNALKYALEKYEYLSSLSDIPELYRYNAINDIVVSKIKSNRLDGIDEYFAKIETYYKSQFGEDSSEYATYLHNRGRAYQLQNRFDDAKKALLKSITIQNKVTGKPSEKTFKYYNEVIHELGEI